MKWIPLISLLTLAGCSTKHTTTYIYVKPPEKLTTYQCYAVKAGHTVDDLASAYVYNLGCIRQYEIMVESLKLYMEKLDE